MPGCQGGKDEFNPLPRGPVSWLGAPEQRLSSPEPQLLIDELGMTTDGSRASVRFHDPKHVKRSQRPAHCKFSASSGFDAISILAARCLQFHVYARKGTPTPRGCGGAFWRGQDGSVEAYGRLRTGSCWPEEGGWGCSWESSGQGVGFSKGTRLGGLGCLETGKKVVWLEVEKETC